MTQPTLWNQLLVWPILNLLIALYKGFTFLRIPGSLGFAIIALTIIIRLILSPLMNKQMKSARQMASLKPKLDDLNKKHGKDKQKLQQAQLELYKEHGINPASGCLPMLVQFPLLIALYGVFAQVLATTNAADLIKQINQVLFVPQLTIQSLDLSFLGTSLIVKPSQWQTQGWWLLSIPLITAALQWYQNQVMMSGQPKTVNQKPDVLVNKDNKQKDKPAEDTASEMQKQMAIMTPIMFGFFAYQFPLGLVLYWNTFGILGIIQQLKINKSLAISTT